MLNITDMYKAAPIEKAIIDSCGDMVVIKNTESKYTFCNKAFLNFLGIEKESDVIGKSSEQIMDNDNAQIINKNFKKTVETLKSVSYLLTTKTEKRLKTLKITTFPIFENEVYTGILSLGRDITSDEELKIKLMDKIGRLNSMIDGMPMLTYMKDCNNNFVFGSRYAEEFVKYGCDLYAGGVCIDVKNMAETTNLDDSFVIKNKKPIKIERKLKSFNGKDHWYTLEKVPIMDENKNVNGVVVTARNIDAEKELELQKELFFATFTHDLKTPLQAQISTLDLLSKGTFGSINESQKEMIDMVIESSNFMREMLYSILSAYKYENGMVKLNKEYFCINEMIDKIIKESSHLAKERKVSIVYYPKIKEQKLYADKSQIRRVLVNLVNNAINYAYKNTLIIMRTYETDKSAIIRISNKSEPISQELKEHIFDKYVSGLNINRKCGIGLGLYFCKKVVDAHLGKIYLETTKEENEFVIELPKESMETGKDILKFV